jgi:hypothetical protein
MTSSVRIEIILLENFVEDSVREFLEAEERVFYSFLISNANPSYPSIQFDDYLL